MNPKYLLGGLVSLPLLPIMFYQGMRIKAKIPPLPEAKGLNGIANVSAKRTIRLITIGESSMAGVGVNTHEEGFTGTLAERLAGIIKVNVSWKVYAKSGFTVKRATQKIIPSIKEDKVDLIVVGLGGNDAFELNTPSGWIKDVHELILSLRTKFGNVPIVFSNMPPIKDFPAFTPLMKFAIGNLVEIFAEELEKVCQRTDHVYFSSEIIKVSDWIDRLGNRHSHEDFFSDGVHPSKLTYQTWANVIAKFIEKEVTL
ncbi:SGNH/GDSL hydrolase family protein [Ekhidna sp.]|uniref:SGNH/GDSL hydrolase family protein n=1 Tax=Ekhidna sp. TaxID=2608089 RepID=UPI003B511EC2